MRLTFEYIADLGSGTNPEAVHLPNGDVYLFSVLDGRLIYRKWVNQSGDVPWGSLVFGDSSIGTRDKSMSLMRLKNVPRVGIFGAWHQDMLYEGENIVSPERQRFGIWDAANDISKYLDTCDLRMDLDNMISTVRFSFKNPAQHLSGEKNSRINPGNKIELFFTAGDSEEYPMGVFYVDSIDMQVNAQTLSVDCRSITGKLLKDQSFDENYLYGYDVYAYNLEAILVNAGVPNYLIQQPEDPETAWKTGMEFPPDMDMLTGLNAYIRASLNWAARETLDGQIIAGSIKTFQPLLDMNGKYTFNRGSDLISRGIRRDDYDVYRRVCCQSKDQATGLYVKVYANVQHEYDWAYAPHKTLYVEAAANTSLEALQEMADSLASRISRTGIMEQFVGPLRPHLIPGDSAEIVSDDGTHLLGTITTISHSMGADGFITSFTVDSAGMLGKPRLKDMISKASGNDKPSGVRQIF